MLSEFREPNVWVCDRICCPSQCYFDFEDKDKVHWVLYLRWRHRGPWSADLFRVIDEIEDDWDWETKEVVPLKKVYQDEEECHDVIDDAYEWLRTVRFPDLSFPDNPKRVERLLKDIL